MDFFSRQRELRSRSFWLYLLFFTVVLLHFLAAIFIFSFIAVFKENTNHRFSLLGHIIIGLFVVGVFFLGILKERKNYESGGRGIAKRLGAKRLFVDTTEVAWYQGNGKVVYDDNGEPLYKITPNSVLVHHERDFPKGYRRFYEYASQMSIASGIATPALFVMPTEMGINGFVAGSKPNDTVMVLTQGAVDNLSDEGLYGLVAHAYGHIIDGDAAFNLKMMLVMGGLELVYRYSSGDDEPQSQLSKDNNWYMIANPELYNYSDIKASTKPMDEQLGYTKQQWVEHWRQQNRAMASYRGQDEEGYERYRGGSRPTFNWIVYLLAGSSLFFAKLIKAGFTRQRNFLADATSIQLTRSKSVVKTLQEIQKHQARSALYTPGVQQLDYLFFAPSNPSPQHITRTSRFDIHPSMGERIEAIDRQAYAEFAQKITQDIDEKIALYNQIVEQKHKGTWQQFHDNNEPERQPYEFTPIKKVVVKGRLDNREFRNEIDAIKGLDILLTPLVAATLSQVPKNLVVTLDKLQGVELPMVIAEHCRQPVGALGVIEAIMLCHHQPAFDRRAKFDLAEIWLGVPVAKFDPLNPSVKPKHLLPHTLNVDLLKSLANHDRRTDELLITKALSAINNTTPTATQLATLTKYLDGLCQFIYLPNQQLQKSIAVEPAQPATTQSPNNTIWQAIQIYRTLTSLQNVVKADNDSLTDTHLEQLSVHHQLQNQTSYQKLIAHLSLNFKQQIIFILFSVLLIDEKLVRDIAKMRDIDNAMLQQWVLPSAHALSRQMRLFDAVIVVDICGKWLGFLLKRHAVLTTQGLFQPPAMLGLIAQIKAFGKSDCKQILMSVHTLMLNDLKLVQDEHDSLLGLAEIWLGERVIVE